MTYFFKLEQMDLEIRDLPNSERGKLMGRMKSYQSEFNRLESQIVSGISIRIIIDVIS